MFITCNTCGWVAYSVTRKEAEAAVAEFNTYFDALPTKEQAFFAGRGTISSYEGCHLCGGNSFRPAQPGDCPDGCTINPAIYEHE